MAKRVILAVAGAGKTYHICHELDPEKRNLILAFTHENTYNIVRELCDAYGGVPRSTAVMTFDSFVYHHMVLPYEPSIAEHFQRRTFASRGICVKTPPSQTIANSQGRIVSNPRYARKDCIEHYVTPQKEYYCDRLSELVLQVKSRKYSLVKRVASRLNTFYDTVMIDEFQDFREYDYELITSLAKSLNDILLVGDYSQHSVSGKRNTGKPFKKKKESVCYEDFVAGLKAKGFEVDTTTLKESRRCAKEVCDFISRKLLIAISSNGNHQGSVIWADDRAKEVLSDDSIIKLVFSGARNYRFPSMNWSYSKGDTVDAACVILTDSFDSLDRDDFSVDKIPVSTINKLYVALTRSRGDLYLIKHSTFKALKDDFKLGTVGTMM